MNEPAHAAGRVTFLRPSRSDCHVSRRVVSLARTTATREKVCAHRVTRRRAAEVRARGALGDMSALANTSAARAATFAVALSARRRQPDPRGPAPGTARRREVAVATRRRGAGATARATGDAHPSGARTPPPGYMCFEVTKTLRVPVPEPSPVRLADGASPRSLERWIDAPRTSWASSSRPTASSASPRTSGACASCVFPPRLGTNPEFDLRILGREGARRPGAIRMRSTRLRLAGDASAGGYPGVRGHVHMERHRRRALRRARHRGRGRRRRRARDHRGVRGPIHPHRRGHPGRAPRRALLQKIGETAVAASLDVVGSGVHDRVQEVYEAWATNAEGGERGEETERGEGTREEGARVEANASVNARR